MKLGDVLQQVYAEFDAAGLYYGHGTDNAWDEAVCLVLCAAELPIDSGEEVLTLPISEAVQARVAEWTKRRINERIPLPYLTGRAWFAGLEFQVRPGTLIPRSPIAELIEQQFSPWCPEPPKAVLDLCTGGGCIAAAVAHHLPAARVDAVDLDPTAVDLAQTNINRLKLSQRVRILQGDLYAPVSGCQYDLIVSNPPYVDAEDMENLPPEYRHEPVHALAAGDDGLLLVHRILREAPHYLKPGGALIVEVGNSAEALMAVYPKIPFIWIDFERGGDGVFFLSREELLKHFTP